MSANTFTVRPARLHAAATESGHATDHLTTAATTLGPTAVRTSIESGYAATVAALAELCLAYNTDPTSNAADCQSFVGQLTDDLTTEINNRRTQ